MHNGPKFVMRNIRFSGRRLKITVFLRCNDMCFRMYQSLLEAATSLLEVEKYSEGRIGPSSL
jgi:hypothetical protein